MKPVTVVVWLGIVVFAYAQYSIANEPKQELVFVAGSESYHTFRIPSLIVTPKGTVLAFCEGRKNNRGDTGDIDLVLKRSFDNGNTWQPMQVVWNDADNTCGNPCPVVDAQTGRIWLLMTHNLRGDVESKIIDGTSVGTRTCWVSSSDDDGATWAAPLEITRQVKLENWTWYATGPGVGIQLPSGRLLIPCDNKVAVTKARQSHVIYSDDHGKSWKLGGVVGPNCNECQAAELSDGRVILNMRSYEANHRRMVATSRDGGLTWTDPVDDPELIEPVCQASILRYRPETVLFSNPASRKRENLAVRVSSDDCRSWSAAKTLHAGPAAYSCLTVLKDGTIGCLYERGVKGPYEEIVLAQISIDWLRGD